MIEKDKAHESVSYELTTFSHDMLNLTMADFLATEEGVIFRILLTTS